ncbi:MAG: hypothetical protein K8M05_20920, partial [Deltaproteobacteria bacterium]|nr:hypothetical protein [Kofleriaceae bacterium]
GGGGGDGEGDGSGGGGGGGSTAMCSLPTSVPDLGPVTATAQLRNQSGSQGALKIYTAVVTLPGSDEVVGVELWDNLGAFAGGAVRAGTFPITGVETSYSTCGVCVIAQGAIDGTTQVFSATSGSVEVVAVGAAGTPLTVRLTNIAFTQMDPMTNMPVANACESDLLGGELSGTLVNVDGGGGGA